MLKETLGETRSRSALLLQTGKSYVPDCEGQ